MREHWVRFLYDIGNGVRYRAENIESKQRKLARLQAEVKALKAEIADDENDLLTYVSTDWNQDEIHDAQAKQKKHGTKEAYHDAVNKQYRHSLTA